MRAITQHHTYCDASHTVAYCLGSEFSGVRIASIIDRGSDAPAVRHLSDGSIRPITEEEDIAPPRGLVIYGTHKWDRPTVAACKKIRGDVDWDRMHREAIQRASEQQR